MTIWEHFINRKANHSIKSKDTYWYITEEYVGDFTKVRGLVKFKPKCPKMLDCQKLSGLMMKTSMSLKSIWIYLISHIKFWNLKSWFRSEKNFFCLKIYFKYGPFGVVPCVCMINLNTCTWHHSAESLFEISNRILKFVNWI